ncbi:hypothetical protein HYY70_02845 [Candidatus Woesearchaeota archaeon]|nr:hypothetical protein [Candidatus Woesearchaeota archaeon]
MRRKDLVLYIIILILASMLLWQWISKSSLINQISQLQRHNSQIQLMTGIGHLGSTHLHADIKVYINGQAIDFSQSKYQLKNSLIHFEDKIGDVAHTHATGLTLGHLFKSIGIYFNNECINIEGKNYCNENSKRLKFYVNGKINNEFDNRLIADLDKYLISYGDENESEIQNQLNSITNLAPRYSLQK